MTVSIVKSTSFMGLFQRKATNFRVFHSSDLTTLTKLVAGCLLANIVLLRISTKGDEIEFDYQSIGFGLKFTF